MKNINNNNNKHLPLIFKNYLNLKLNNQNKYLKQNVIFRKYYPQTREWKLSIYKHNNNLVRSIKSLIGPLSDLINIYFSKILTTKPIFKLYNNKLIIIIYYYSNKKTKIKSLYNKGNLFNNYIEKLFKEKVEFRLIKIRYPYLNAEILSKYLAIKSKRINFYRLNLKLHRKMRKARYNIKTYLLPLTIISNSLYPIKSKLKELNRVNYLSSLSFKHLIGMHLELNGRMSKRRKAQRTVKRSSYKGSLKNIYASYFNKSIIPLRNIIKPNIDYAKFSTKNRNGAYSFKVWLSGQ